MNQTADRSLADRYVLYFTGIAAATGAVPVPAASAAVVAENVAMINTVAATMGVPVSPVTVTTSFGPALVLNQFGKTLFIEVARVLNWGATGGLATAAVSAYGAFTAAGQTWILGHLTIAICENGGHELAAGVARRVVSEASESFKEVWERVSKGVPHPEA